MKNVLLLAGIFFSLLVYPQAGGSNDLLFTTKGEIIQGKVTKVTANTINFTYPNETLVNEMSVGNLEKIVFSSGRTQTFGNAQAPAAPSSSTQIPLPSEPAGSAVASSENKGFSKDEVYLGPDYKDGVLAVLPIAFNSNGTYSKELSNQSTTYATEYLSKTNSLTGVQVQDMKATINRLISANIGFKELETTPIDQLQKVLGAEYVVVVSLQEKNDKTQAAPVKRGFYDDGQAEQAAAVAQAVDINVELVMYGGFAKETYSTTFSEQREVKGKLDTSIQKPWKAAVGHVLMQMVDSISF